ncbi:MAG TPA: hypothetical protein PKW90_02570, partial [Myxococcota bacterium]|nr:hypothetical protein [Myxococcota bacterium]
MIWLLLACWRPSPYSPPEMPEEAANALAQLGEEAPQDAAAEAAPDEGAEGATPEEAAPEEAEKAEEEAPEAPPME